jgi:Calcineurin-like phosphoesterase
MTRRLTIACVALVLALAGALGAASEGHTNPRDDTTTLGVIGDVPYTPLQFAAFPAWVADINADPDVESAVHLGDIKSGSTLCSDEYYASIAGFFSEFADPLVFTPGDNEWTDCHRLNNGAYNPLERLAKLRSVFFPQPNSTLGKKTHVRSQPSYPENVQWKEAKTVFSAVHVVGSNNGFAPWTGQTQPTPEQLAEANARIAAAIAWVDDAFDKAERTKARGVVLMMQADTFSFGNRTATGFVAILDRIEERAADFEKPVLLLQGDTHVFLVDAPLADAPNVTRIVVEGADAGNEWLKITVDPRSPGVFSWERVDF